MDNAKSELEIPTHEKIETSLNGLEKAINIFSNILGKYSNSKLEENNPGDEKSQSSVEIVWKETSKRIDILTKELKEHKKL